MRAAGVLESRARYLPQPEHAVILLAPLFYATALIVPSRRSRERGIRYDALRGLYANIRKEEGLAVSPDRKAAITSVGGGSSHCVDP